MGAPAASVIVCTYNRCDSLRDTLRALNDQRLSGGRSLEIIVVDNNSKDGTRSAAEQAMAGARWPIRYLLEERQGLSHARNCGIQAARGQTLLFTDDDALPDERWVDTLLAAMEACQADAAGGRVLPLWLTTPPAWLISDEFRKLVSGVIGFLDHGPDPIVATVEGNKFLYGANMAFRASVFAEFGMFNLELGRIGTRLLSGEETEFLDRIFAARKRVVYTPDAVVYHKVPAERMSRAYARRWHFNAGRSHVLMASPRRGAPWWLVKECLASGLRAGSCYLRGQLLDGLRHELVGASQLGQIVQRVQGRPSTATNQRPTRTGPHAAPPPRALVDMTVIVPTKDRAASLEETLRSLAAQETGGRFTYEVLVVDNASTDRTRQLVAGTAPTYPVALRYAHEAQVGRSYALNIGIQQARGAILAFTDDDIIAAPGWLRGLWSAFTETGADAVGGRIVPHWLDPRPEWLTDEFVRLGRLGCIDHGETRIRVPLGSGYRYRWVGGNVAIRREIAQRVGGYDVRMVRAQDTEYYLRCLKAGVAIVYEPSALVHHKVAADRMTPEYFRWWVRRSGYYHTYLMPWRKHHLLTLFSADWYADTLKVAWARLCARRDGIPKWKLFHYELVLLERWHHLVHRLQLWPRWLLTVATGRSFLP